MAIKHPGVWGIDLGQCGLKALRLEKIDGQVTATAFDYVEHPKILSQPDADPDQLIREALEKFLSRNDLRGDMVSISVPGQSGLARFVKLPPVEEKKINDIVRFEAKQQIPFPLDEVVWDFQKIGEGTVTDGFALDTEIGLFAMKRDLVSRYLQHFKEVGVEIHFVQMAPLALCNFVAFELLGKATVDGEQEAGEEAAGKKQCVVALDIGADSSNLVITDGGRVIWQRPIPLGGNHFTRALTKDLKLTFAKAEHVKRTAVKSPDLRKILAALKPVLNDFVSEVQRSLGYFTNTHRDAQVKYMIGLGNAFRLPGLQKYLQEKLQLEVRKLQRVQRLAGESVTAAPQLVENLPSFAVAYGLALQGLDEGKVRTNLLPHEIRFERLVRAKKPWAAAAAAALVLAVGSLTFGYSVEWRTIENDGVKKALEAGKKVIDEKNRIRGEWDGFDRKVTESKIAVRHIAAGVDERFNWNLLYKYINDALPLPYGITPDGRKVLIGGNKRLTKETRTRVTPAPNEEYDTQEAAEAYAELLNMQFVKQGERVPNAKEEQEKDLKIKKSLIRINIEGIDCLWSEDLAGFYRNLTADKENRLIGLTQEEKDMLAKEIDKLPKKGWVVEIRGSTYHQGGVKFVENTLVENLALPEKVGNDYKKQADELAAQLKEVNKNLETLGKQLQDLDKAKKAADKKQPGKTKTDSAPAGEDKKPTKEVQNVDEPQKTELLAKQRREMQKKKDLEEKLQTADQMKKYRALANWQERAKEKKKDKEKWEERDQVHLVVLYQWDKDSGLSRSSVLGSLMADSGGMDPGKKQGVVPAKGANPPPGKGGAQEGKAVASRSGWGPIGDIASSTLSTGGKAGNLGPGPVKAPPRPVVEGPSTRQGERPVLTEFVILMVWEEPLPPEGGPATRK
jgi:type IV pilus assembly protein PilM